MFGLFWLGVDPLDHDQQGRGRDRTSTLFTHDDATAGRESGGLLNAFFGSAVIMCLLWHRARHAGRHRRGNLAGRVRAPRRLGQVDPLRQRHPAVRPSIVLGLFVYTIWCADGPASRRWPAPIALAFIVAAGHRAHHRRDAAPGAGADARSRAFARRAAMEGDAAGADRGPPGIVTGVLLALARISGETAPLLFTAYSNQYWSTDLTGPMASVPVVMFQYAMSPYESWQRAGLGRRLHGPHLFVLLLSLLARAVLSGKQSSP
jgi:phosphate transport system permease protein